jgi:hypothetical protein
MRFIMVLAASVLISSAYATDISTTIRVSGPTVIAFIPPITQADSDKDEENTEALDDIQWYLSQVKAKLEKAGIVVREVNTEKVEIFDGNKKIIFQPRKGEFGYYFIAPGRQPKVEYGVMTDMDLLDVAGQYFRIRKLQ